MSELKSEPDVVQESFGSLQLALGLRWTRIKDSFKPQETIHYPDNASFFSNDLAKEGQEGPTLKRHLKSRHIQMIAIGGSIGTGLFVGSGGSLRTGGPAALLIAWGLVSTMLIPVVMALGELCVAFPINGAFAVYASRFVDPSWGFAVGITYALMWLIVFPLELVASAMCILYWNDNINPVAWVAIFYVFILGINLFGVRGYGEAEYFLTIVKIVAIVGFIILGIVLVCGGGPTHEFIGGRHFHEPGAFAHGFKGVAGVFVTASYSMTGAEMVGLASAETQQPQRVLPKAVRQVFIRLILFFMLSLLFVGLLVPYNDPMLLGRLNVNSTSPFVIAIKRAEIYALPSIFNACILFTVVSVGNSAVYGCSRTIHSLAEQGFLPRKFAYLDRKGRPLMALATSAVFGLLCFLSAYKEQGEVFAWLLSVSGLATVFSWFNIALCQVRLRWALKAQGRSSDELTYKSGAGIIGSIYAMGFLITVLGLQFWTALFPVGNEGKASAYNFFQSYLCAPIFLALWFGHAMWRVYKGTFRFIIPLAEVDLDTGRRSEDIEVIKADIEEYKRQEAAKPFYARWFNYWC